MNYTYFLASNSAAGFYSIYNTFPPDEDDFLHIIKGGPGSGKSGLMRRIGKSAEDCGYDVHYILCSGDPDSLDGVYIPHLHQAWVDGTNPHVREPDLYGVNSDYVDLGAFFSGELSGTQKHYVSIYNKAYKQKYSSAYKLLSAALQLQKFYLTDSIPADKSCELFKALDGILEEHHALNSARNGSISYRFLNCIGCRGDYRLYSEFEKLCKAVYVIRSGFCDPDIFLRYLASYAETNGENAILCPSPLNPKKLTAVIFPDRALAFADSSWEFKNCTFINFDYLYSSEISSESLPDLETARELESETFKLAYKKMSEAKKLHDLLEQQYHQNIDFAALTQFTDEQIDRLFK